MLPAMRLCLALLLFAHVAARGAALLEDSYAAQGRLIVTQFVSAPFPHPARAGGHTYKDKLYLTKDHYADSTVAIFIPKGLRDSDRVDFVIHFHGWNNTVAGTLSGYRLVEQFVAAGRNAVLVVPEGPHNVPDSFGGKLEDPGGFNKFVDELVATLKQRAVFNGDFVAGDIILSGHSGGYRVISAILDRGGRSASVKEVWLLDALYAESEKFLAWWDKHHGRLINIYTDGGGTKDDSEALMQRLRQRGTPFLATEEIKVTPDELKTNKLIFLHTDLPHNDVVAKRNQFRLYLQTSQLADLKPAP